MRRPRRYARRGRVVPLEEAETFDSINLGEDIAESDVPHLDLCGPRFENMKPGTTSRVIGGLHIREGEKFELYGEIAPLDGVWDLPMIGAERFDVMHEYEKQTGGPGVTSVCSDGTFVEGTDGTLFQLQKNFDESKYCWNHADNYHPAGGLPSDSVFVVRCPAIQDFLDVQWSITSSPQEVKHGDDVSDDADTYASGREAEPDDREEHPPLNVTPETPDLGERNSKVSSPKAVPTLTRQPSQIRKRGRRPRARESATRALTKLYPNQIPNSPWKTITAEVNDHLRDGKENPVSEDTVRRAASEL